MSKLLENLREQGEDIQGAMERFLDDEELYEQCFESFLEDRAFEQLASSLKNQSYDEAFDYAHMLKGVSGNLGLTTMFEMLSQMVSLYREKKYNEM
ncbi:MAG: Hpt domain-containing protein, partial [Oscillospiraceae bacterium]